MQTYSIAIGSDHAGYNYKEAIKAMLLAEGHTVRDFGTHSPERCDFPDFCFPVARAVAAGEYERGIVLGGSGNGEQMAANKVRGARAALVWSDATATLAREHNDANVISIGARQHTVEEAKRFIDLFIATPFSFEERHERRIEQLAEYESTGAIAGRDVLGL